MKLTNTYFIGVICSVSASEMNKKPCNVSVRMTRYLTCHCELITASVILLWRSESNLPNNTAASSSNSKVYKRFGPRLNSSFNWLRHSRMSQEIRKYPKSESLFWRRLRLRALSVLSELVCSFVATYLTSVQFILQLKLCTLLCTFY